MDNQDPDKNNRATFAQIYTNLFASRRAKFLLFFGTLVVAIIISAVFSGNFSSMEIGDFFNGLVLLQMFLFPVGIALSIPGVARTAMEGHGFYLIPIAFFSAIILWPVYIGIVVLGVKSRSLRNFIDLFLVFVILLLLNVRGCVSNSSGF